MLLLLWHFTALFLFLANRTLLVKADLLCRRELRLLSVQRVNIYVKALQGIRIMPFRRRVMSSHSAWNN